MNIEKMLSIAFLVPMNDPNSSFCKWGLNVMLWGEPGIGKSERVEAAGAMVGLPVRTTFVPTCQPEDASGTAFVNNTKANAMFDEVVTYLDSEGSDGSISQFLGDDAKGLVKRLSKISKRYGSGFARIEPLLPGVSDLLADGQGVWFLDELSSGRPAVQAGFLGAALARRVGGLHLPPGVRIVAAGNPPECAAGGWELEPPMANRWCHFEIKTPNAYDFTNWLMSEGQSSLEAVEDGEEKVRQGWQKHWPAVKGLFSGFLKANPSLLHKLPKEGHKDRGRAWPSPRTIYFAMRAVATCRCLGVDQKTTSQFVEGCIGEAAAAEFESWAINADLPDPEHVLNNGWTPDKKRLDRCVAVYTSAVAFTLASTTEKEAYGIKAWNLLKSSADNNLLDLTIPLAETLIQNKLDSKFSKDMATACQPVMVALSKMQLEKLMRK